MEALRRLTPAAIVLDLSLASENGLDLLPRLSALPSRIPVLVYSMHEDPLHVRRALAAGAAGYVTKNSDADHLVAGIRAVALGGRYLDPPAARAVRDDPAALLPADPERALSERELKVFRLLGEGFGASEIATRLGISRKTVESYFQRIMNKLGLEGMKALHRHAIAGRIPE
jgi:DNA-binding NarL/FixJ family response regulator